METTNLKLRGQTYYARLAVPVNLQETLGKSELMKSLGTTDLREANRRKHSVLDAMHKTISSAATGRPRGPLDEVLDTAKQLRDSIASGATSHEDAEIAFGLTIDSYLEHAGRRHGIDRETGHPNLPEAHETAIRLAHEVFATGNVTLLSQSTEDYLKETAPRVRVATINEKRRQLTEFAKWLKTDVAVGTITKKTAGRYVSEVLLAKGHAPKTVKDTLSNLSAFFVWLEGRGHVETNPWRGMSATVKGSTRGTAPPRRPWNEDELHKLLTSLPTDDVLLPLTALAAYTGMRLEELASMKTENVTDTSLRVVEGKTKASVRYIPAHTAIRPLLTRLLKTASDGYLLPGLISGGADDKRGKLVGKRFGETIRRLGFDDPALTFHTLRNSFMSRCEAASVPESTTKLLVGHARQSLTYGLYSPGVEFEQLAAAVAKISHGKSDAFVASIGPDLSIKAIARRHLRRD